MHSNKKEPTNTTTWMSGKCILLMERRQASKVTYNKSVYLFIYFGCPTQLAGSEFPEQGLDQ